MVLCIPGQGSPGWATAKAAVGVTILFAAGCNPVAGKMVGPAVLEAGGARPSCLENREQGPTTSAQYQTSAACELPFLHPDNAGMETTREQTRGGQKDK